MPEQNASILKEQHDHAAYAQRTLAIDDYFTKAVDYDVNNNAIYVGYATPGSNKASAVWRIQKITYDANNNPTDIQWADSNTNFDNIWDNRTSGTYG